MSHVPAAAERNTRNAALHRLEFLKGQVMDSAYSGFYINLDRSTQRKEEIETQLEQFSLLSQYSRFSAADGNVLGVEGSSLHAGEIGCFTSHYLLLEKNLNQAHHLHVMEDDVILSRATYPSLQMLNNSEMMNNYDIIFTDTCLPYDPRAIRELKTLYDASVEKDETGKITSLKKITVIDLLGRYLASMSSFLVYKNSIAKLHALLQQELKAGPRMPVDLFIRAMINKGLIRAGCIFPFTTSIRLEHLVSSSIFDRSEVVLPLLAFSLLRHSFFIECDYAKCNQLINDHFMPIKRDTHQSLLSHVFDFVLNDDRYYGF
jgi:GR25 family glycosyltransferase involved in LPS biosynthesis